MYSINKNVQQLIGTIALVALMMVFLLAPFSVVPSEHSLHVDTAHAATNCSPTDGYSCIAGEIADRIGNNVQERSAILPVAQEICREVNSADATCVNNAINEYTSGTPAAAARAQANAEKPGWWWTNVTGPALEWLLTTIAWLPIAISGGILTIVGIGFDAAIEYTITNFSALFSGIESGITVVWETFRDIANIVMIAMFVFVAFAVILGLETYGLKTFGVRILMIALLLNFSLFFTKVIIDASNFTAFQFTKAANAEVASGQLAKTGSSILQVTEKGVGVTATDLSKQGIAGAVVSKAGLSGAFDSSELTRIYNSETGGIGKMFLYSLVVSIFFIATAAVLLYGIILLLYRVVVLMFLLMTSALAFVAYMTPKMESQWDKWWSMLITNALFAPLFMLLLWAVLKVASELAGGDGFAEVITNPSQGGLTALFNIAIIIGMLYGATKIANDLSLWGAKQATHALGRTATLGGAAAFLPWALLAKRPMRKAAGVARKYLPVGEKANAALKKVERGALQFGDTKISKQLEKMTGVKLGAKSASIDQLGERRKEYEKDNVFGPDLAKRTAAAAAGGVAGLVAGKSKKEADQTQGSTAADTTQQEPSASPVTQRSVLDEERKLNSMQRQFDLARAEIGGGSANNMQKRQAKKLEGQITEQEEKIQNLKERLDEEAVGRTPSQLSDIPTTGAPGTDGSGTSQTPTDGLTNEDLSQEFTRLIRSQRVGDKKEAARDAKQAGFFSRLGKAMEDPRKAAIRGKANELKTSKGQEADKLAKILKKVEASEKGISSLQDN